MPHYEIHSMDLQPSRAPEAAQAKAAPAGKPGALPYPTLESIGKPSRRDRSAWFWVIWCLGWPIGLGLVSGGLVVVGLIVGCTPVFFKAMERGGRRAPSIERELHESGAERWRDDFADRLYSDPVHSSFGCNIWHRED